MSAKFQFIGAACLVVLAAGCASKDEPIVFTSAVTIPAAMAEASAVARGANGLSKADQQQIDLVAFSYLLERHFWGDGIYSAFFIQADDDVVAALIRKYPDHVPPVKPADHLDLRSNQSPLDRDTGLPVLILSTESGAPQTDGSVAVTGRWYAGAATSGSYTFSIERNGDNWAVASVK